MVYGLLVISAQYCISTCLSKYSSQKSKQHHSQAFSRDQEERLMAIKHETLVQQDQMDSFQTLCMLSLVAG